MFLQQVPTYGGRFVEFSVISQLFRSYFSFPSYFSFISLIFHTYCSVISHFSLISHLFLDRVSLLTCFILISRLFLSCFSFLPYFSTFSYNYVLTYFSTVSFSRLSLISHLDLPNLHIAPYSYRRYSYVLGRWGVESCVELPALQYNYIT